MQLRHTGGLLALLLLGGCEAPSSSDTELAPYGDSDELVVLTRNAPTAFYIDRDNQPAGFEYDLVRRFADDQGLELRLEVRHSIGDIIQGLKAGEAHMAAAGLTRLPSREAEFRFGPAYREVQQQLVCHRSGPMPTELDALADVSLLVAGGSSYEELLDTLRLVRLPELTWESDPDITTELALRRVWERKVDCTLADSNIVSINRRYYPELQVVMPMGEPQKLAWMLPPDADGLAAALDEWFPKMEASGLYDQLETRYYAHVVLFDYVDTARYLRRIEDRLSRYRPLFERAGERYNLDWHLLAALSYQESHWDPGARSPTGVRGLMMLTQPTAAEVGVSNRLDEAESIMGGARYLASLHDRLPDSVTEPDRTWIALAAYNVGIHHIYDARRLARHYNSDPDTWLALQDMLPKLSRPEYYRFLPNGYARGHEPVHYVKRIRNYRELLERYLAGGCADDECA